MPYQGAFSISNSFTLVLGNGYRMLLANIRSRKGTRYLLTCALLCRYFFIVSKGFRRSTVRYLSADRAGKPYFDWQCIPFLQIFACTPVYVVGEATGELARRELACSPVGEQAGSARDLAQFIIEHHRDPASRPLLFPSANLAKVFYTWLFQEIFFKKIAIEHVYRGRFCLMFLTSVPDHKWT
jgi:hypothetical protein